MGECSSKQKNRVAKKQQILSILAMGNSIVGKTTLIRLISSTSRGDTITYTDFNVTLYYSFTFNSIEHPHSEQYNIVTKKGLHANLFYTQFELNQNLDGTLAFTDGSPDVTEIELGDIEDYIMFKEIYKNDSEMLKDKLVSAWVEDLH